MKLGIDFGTTRIVVAACDRGNYPVVSFEDPDGEVCDWFPPLIGVRDGKRIHGWEAWKAQDDPLATVVRSFKRHLAAGGPLTPVDVGGHTAPLLTWLTELAAALMTALREESSLSMPEGEPLECVLGVPAGANSNQRFLTVEAFRRAGFDCTGLLNEPSAASIEFSHSQREKSSRKDTIIVYDLGGGTFDASLVELESFSHAVLASEGIPALGGDDFDHILAELALASAGISANEAESLTQSEWYRLEEEARRKKESLHPNSRRVVLELDGVRPDWPETAVATSEFYARCEPLIAETIHAVEDLSARASSLEAVYIAGGGSEMPLIGRMLRDKFKGKVKRSPYARAATAIGLAIQASKADGYVLRDHFTRYFGVWREAEGGLRVRFDPLFEKGTALPAAGEPPLEQLRAYDAVHNIGHFRYLECSHLTPEGQPSGDITIWDEIHYPFDPALRDADNLNTLPVYHTWDYQPIRESYCCGAGGELSVSIANLGAGYERSYRLGRWGERAEPIVPGKKRKTPPRRKKATSE